MRLLSATFSSKLRFASMTTRIKTVKIKNCRSLADVSISLGGVNLFFGPNGSGKSTLLDSLRIIHDCAVRGIEPASSSRGHGIGSLWDQATEDDQSIQITLSTEQVEYELSLNLATGRIDSNPGELLRKANGEVLIQRKEGTDIAKMYNEAVKQVSPITLRDPKKLSLNLYLNFNQTDQQTGELDRLLHNVRYFHSRSFFLCRLKTSGSESTPFVRLYERGENAWSVLRNLHDFMNVDERFNTIVEFMSKAFPTFGHVIVEQTGSNSVFAKFQERNKTNLVHASGVSDGHLQLLLLLLALFSERKEQASLLLFDEPEVSLHPWAISVFAEAVKLAASQWNRQVLISSHSPVLISQFEPANIFSTAIVGAKTEFMRLTEVEGISDLLEDYAAGSLYMSELVGSQSKDQNGRE